MNGCRIYVDIMIKGNGHKDFSYLSVRSFSRRGTNMDKGKDGGYSYFSPLQVSLY